MTTLAENTDTPNLLQYVARLAGISNPNPGVDRLEFVEFVVAEMLAGTAPIQSGAAFGAAAGAAASAARVIKNVTGLADTVAGTAITVTVPNVKAGALIRVTLVGSLGAGGAIGAGEGTHAISYDFVILRTPGVNAVGLISTAYGSAKNKVAGAVDATTAGALSAVVGAVGAVNTFTITVAVTKASGSSDNHTALVVAEVFNEFAGGVTIA